MKKILLLTAAVATAVVSAYSQNIPSYVPTDGLVGWWPFNGNANDESGNGNNGTVNGGTTLTSDRFDVTSNAYSVDGINCEGPRGISVPVSLNNNSDWSISLWFQSLNTADNYQCIFNSMPQRVIAVAVNRPPYPMNSIYSLQGDGTNWSALDDVVFDIGQINSWRNIIVSQANMNLKYYIDGTLHFNQDISTITGNSVFSIVLGALSTSEGPNCFEPLNGKIDDIGIWNRALTESEIQQLYEGCTVQDIAISGNNTPAALQPSTYTCTGEAGSTFTWTVTNGVITSGQGTNTISVVWAETGLGSISVQETTSANCIGDPITLDVVVITTSVNELSVPEICIYPNPASNRLSIAQDASFNGKSYAIYDIAGSLVHMGKLVGNITSLSLEEFAIGQYTLRVEGSSPKTFAVVKE